MFHVEGAVVVVVVALAVGAVEADLIEIWPIMKIISAATMVSLEGTNRLKMEMQDLKDVDMEMQDLKDVDMGMQEVKDVDMVGLVVVVVSVVVVEVVSAMMMFQKVNVPGGHLSVAVALDVG